ncbi:MAG: nucleotidyltransferase family protein [Bacteroides sp.]|nr:nucleotidyltransferase family protein [Bacteroides sp.]MCM1413250.1 nucleotidyltransferase family protein [Bacteroides sp.]MCM1471440.1 nucleotidyltransferase family protein [Bacteroides sp.]
MNTSSPLLQLLRYELWRTPTGPIALNCADDWNELFRQAQQQTVTALTLNAIEHLADPAVTPPLPLAALWMARAEEIRSRNRTLLSIEHSLLTEMKSHGLSPMVLKGHAVAVLYPEPNVRQSGDIDLYIPADQSSGIIRFLSANGLTPVKMADGSISFRWREVEVELHPRLFDIHRPEALRRLMQMPELVKLHNFEPHHGLYSLPVPSPEATLLLLSAHIFKHAIGHGIGLRQLIDLAVASQNFNHVIDRDLMRSAIAAAGLKRWTSVVYSYLVTDLGMPADYLPYPDIKINPRRARQLRRIIDRGGNFGFYRADSIPSRRGKLSTLSSFIRRSRFSLATAPRETIATVATLIRNSLCHSTP